MVRKSSGQDPRSCVFPPLRRLPLMLCRLLRSICCLALLSAAGCLVTGSGEGPEVARWLLHRCGEACSLVHIACNVRLPWAAINKRGGGPRPGSPLLSRPPFLLLFWAAAVALPISLVLTLHVATSCCWLPSHLTSGLRGCHAASLLPRSICGG